MKHKVSVGGKSFESKADALAYFKAILNSYEFGERLKEFDFNDVISLIESHPKREKKMGAGIKEVRVVKSKYNSKCFELVRVDGTAELPSYTKRINSPPTPFSIFLNACRQAIQEDLRNVKLVYFQKHSKKGAVKCQETGKYLKWEELSIDHRQPNTFSIIVDRFIEIHNLDVNQIQILEIEGGPNELADSEMKEKFREYHKKKANLRIVSKRANLGRSHQAKIIRQKKDLVIE